MAFLIVTLLFAAPAAYAHPGGLDGMGGHYDNSTGIYHFHHGFSAHHHPNGVCPYDSSRTYPTDKPSRSTQTSRPNYSSKSSISANVSRSASAATRVPTVKPSATPSPKAKVSRDASNILAFGAIVLTAFFILVSVTRAKTPAPAPPPILPTPALPVKPIPVAAPDPSLVKVSIVCGYHLSIDFSNNETRYFDAIFLLSDPAYEPLADYNLFKSFRISPSDLLLYWAHYSISVTAKRLYRESQSYPTVTVTERDLPF